ncbi:MAG: hypothetical protein ACJAXW_004315 [Candidatus Azotimanducaceae bacterium]|jgi:uncharacterized protein YigA (DUF484 family)
MTAKKQKQDIVIEESAVETYLRENPDFFVTHNDLLTEITLPHGESGSISLVEKQVSVLRDRNKESRKRLDEYLKTAKHNDDVFKKCQYMILGLIESDDQESFLKNMEKGFKRDFKSNAYSLMIFGDKPRQINHFTNVITRSSANEYVSSLIRSTKPTLGTLRPAEQDFLFRHQSDKVKSAVVMSVREGREQLALLAIGSSDANYFKPGMGTLFIGFIADALARLIPRFITGPG